MHTAILDWISESAWCNVHAIPVYTSVVSVIMIFARAWRSFLNDGRSSQASSLGKLDLSLLTFHAIRSEAHGGCVILAMKTLRLLGCLGLLCISISRYSDTLDLTTILEPSHITFVYASLLAFLVILYPQFNTTLPLHLTVVLASSWTVYFARDLIPLMTYTRHPADPPYMLWEFIGVLTFTTILLPLFTPRRYIPFDASDPKPPNPEQTASPLSLLLFSFLDTTVWKAYHTSHLLLADLPVLADSSHSKHLVHAAFPHLDPLHNLDMSSDFKNSSIRPPNGHSHHRNIYTAVFTVFQKDIFMIILFVLLYTLATLLSPYGLRELLEYMGSGGEGAIVKPWVWIGTLFIAPFAITSTLQQYQTRIMRVTVRLEAILTQLILQHALRIRIVAEGGSETPTNANADTVASSATASTLTSSSTKSNGTASTSTSALSTTLPAHLPPAAVKAGKSLMGRLNNLISSDMQAISQAVKSLQILLSAPILIVMTLEFLYVIMGRSALVGFSMTLLLMPLPALFTWRLQRATREMVKKSDDRVEAVAETMSVIRMVKMFGWEKKMCARIDEKRNEELAWLWWSKVYAFANSNFNHFFPAVIMCSAFLDYTLIMKRTLNAATVFSSIALFGILRRETLRLSLLIPIIIKGQVSLQRVGDFLEKTELLDKFSSDYTGDFVDSPSNSRNDFGFGAATFSWSNESISSETTSPQRQFRLRIDDELIFKRGCINLIIGPTGSGKTSLLMALLGEMHFLPSGPNSWFNLPRSGGTAYAAQESWVLNATIRENILFGSPFDEERYNTVIYQCALTRDLELLSAGDLIEIGERGLTLSGGQKARVTLARAVYSSAEILLLDDVLAALDAHTAKWIVDKCLDGELIRSRTVLLVAYNIKMVAPISNFVVVLGRDGQISNQGSISDVLEADLKFNLETPNENIVGEEVLEEVNTQKADALKGTDGKLILEEETAVGHVTFASIKMYLIALGGPYWVLFWHALITSIFLVGVTEAVLLWLLGDWATQYQEHPPEEVNIAFYLTVYIGLTSLKLFIFFANQLSLTSGALRASALLHKILINSILGTTLRWLDKTPTSRVIARVTQDIATVDSSIPGYLFHILEVGINVIIRFIAIMLYTPTVGTLGLGILIVGGTVGNIYMKSQLSVKREMSKTKAPIMAHFAASIEGLISIRAYGAQNAVLSDSLSKIDNYSRTAIVFNDLACWAGVRVDALGGLFAALLGWYYVYGPNPGISTSNSAFTLSMAVSFGSTVLMFVQMLNMFEVNGNSLERLQEYMSIEQEAKPTKNGLPPAHWPSSGELRVEKLSAKYSPDGPPVLHDISFNIKSGERIGVVGRTGSGKSSLTLALLRCIFTDGEVFYDGLPTSKLNLDALRSQITIIPQVPELLSGTLRRNLDPFDQFDDDVLYAALRDAGLYSTQNEDDKDKITLDSVISRGGSNLSVGQRQIIALARAVIRESKLLILDEATSAVDYETDEIIQRSLRNEIKKDVTLIAVAHRLKTVMDSDRIMVLDAGRIVEFDCPSKLLEIEGGFFRSLVDESGDRETLHAAARRGPLPGP